MLFFAAIVGTICFVYGFLTYDDNEWRWTKHKPIHCLFCIKMLCFINSRFVLLSFPYSKEICSEEIGGNIVMCPLCDKKCGYWKLNSTCNSSWVRHSSMSHILHTFFTACGISRVVVALLKQIWPFVYHVPPSAITPVWQCGNSVLCHIYGDLGWVQMLVVLCLFCFVTKCSPCWTLSNINILKVPYYRKFT